MILISVFILISLAIFILFKLSAKQMLQTGQSRFALLTQHSKLSRACAWLSLLVAMCLLSLSFGVGIGVVSLCVYASPLLFLFILYQHDAKSNKPNAH